jgi:hypothetical protein
VNENIFESILYGRCDIGVHAVSCRGCSGVLRMGLAQIEAGDDGRGSVA